MIGHGKIITANGLVTLVAGLWFTGACAENTASTPPDAAPVSVADAPEEPPTAVEPPLVPIAEVEGDFLMRQKLVAEHDGKKHRFEAVVQKQGGVLSIIGMTPFGTKAFLIRQEGTEVSFESFIDREIPFPPRHVLEDVNRSFLWHVRLPWGREGGDGESSAEVLGETVTERWSAGKLVERRFVRGGDGGGSLRIDYGDGMQGDRPPRTIRLENGWHGYTLTIETPEYRRL